MGVSSVFEGKNGADIPHKKRRQDSTLPELVAIERVLIVTRRGEGILRCNWNEKGLDSRKPFHQIWFKAVHWWKKKNCETDRRTERHNGT